MGYPSAMSSRSLSEVLSLARELSPGDKLGLVAELIDDVECAEDEQWASTWRAELDRRTTNEDERTGTTASQAIADARKTLRKT